MVGLVFAPFKAFMGSSGKSFSEFGRCQARTEFFPKECRAC